MPSHRLTRSRSVSPHITPFPRHPKSLLSTSIPNPSHTTREIRMRKSRKNFCITKPKASKSASTTLREMAHWRLRAQLDWGHEFTQMTFEDEEMDILQARFEVVGHRREYENYQIAFGGTLDARNLSLRLEVAAFELFKDRKYGRIGTQHGGDEDGDGCAWWSSDPVKPPTSPVEDGVSLKPTHGVVGLESAALKYAWKKSSAQALLVTLQGDVIGEIDNEVEVAIVNEVLVDLVMDACKELEVYGL